MGWEPLHVIDTSFNLWYNMIGCYWGITTIHIYYNMRSFYGSFIYAF